MAIRAVLVCADEKASSAISQVLTELEVSVEPIRDTSTASAWLSSQACDIVLVDCDDEQEASLIFDTLKTASVNRGATSVAIVDGKAGVPTAFRLGASFVLTKPLSLEQARGTLRNALAMRRRTASENKSFAAAAAARGEAASKPAVETSIDNEILSHHATASAAAVPALIPTLSPVDAPHVSTQPGHNVALGSGLVIETPARKSSRSPKPTEAPPVSAKVEKTIRKTSLPEVAQAAGEESEDLETVPPEPVSITGAAAKVESRETNKGLKIALVFALILAGFYAAWTMSPPFHDATLSQYEHFHSMITGSARPAAQPLSTPQKPAVSQASPNPVQGGTQPGKVTPKASGIPDGFSADAVSVEGAVEPGATNAVAPEGTDSPGVTELQEISEDLADEHVTHRVRPTYPVAAVHKGLKGSVVLGVVIDRLGAVTSAEVISGNSAFTTAAVAAVKQWHYETYYQGGRPIAFATKVSLQFVPPGQ